MCDGGAAAADTDAAAPRAPVASNAQRVPDAVTPDGGRYYGPLVDGKRQGQGRVEWDAGTSYVGGFIDGLYAGHGRLEMSGGAVYDGQFSKGVMAGRGTLTSAAGGTYAGEFAEGVFEGQGKYTLANGGIYEGHFHHGQFDGQGKYVTGDIVYTGMFKNGEFAGHGELTNKRNGGAYRGEFLHGVMQGKGRYTTPNGDVYEGDFVHDAFTGEGAFIGTDGTSIKGTFVDWKASGRAVAVDSNGNRYEANFVQNEPASPLHLVRKDGAIYDGDTRNWMPDGKGVMHLANGDVYTGLFTGGLYNGEGTLVLAKPLANGRKEVSGTWRYGRPDDSERRARIEARVESALYGQRSLLDAELATLQPRDPSHINLYLLAVAGGGTQEVFHREADFVRNEFDSMYGTRGHSLVLVNSRTTVGTLPMATLTSIREALAKIASTMDKQRDILFVFMTSHGSANHELTLSLDGMSLPDLSASRLGELIAATGIRWKVVVISACYAGGFVDDLKDGTTLVMTAARRDRTSFGCADDNDFTYFGRAYFKESLPASQSFEQAFHKADTLIREWEDKDAADERKSSAEAGKGAAAAPAEAPLHSEPQLYETPAIAAYLKTWREQLPKP